MLNEGDKAPQFTIPTDTGSFSMAEANGPVVVFFFPKADTPGCTKESIAFSQLKSEFDALNTAVIGISKDKPAKQGKPSKSVKPAQLRSKGKPRKQRMPSKDHAGIICV